MALNTSSVSRSLDRKLKIAGFEVPDILAIFLLLALLNFLFAGHSYKLLLSWGPAAVLALVLRIGKRGKPENYLVHLVKFWVSPKYLSAFPEAIKLPLIKRNKELSPQTQSQQEN